MKKYLKKLPVPFKKVLKIISARADDLGVDVYLVGGVARDLSLGKEICDLDIVVVGDAVLLCRAVASCLKKDFVVHHAFKTATLFYEKHTIDFATARCETYASPGALPIVKSATLKEDLFRRDFTMNALAISINQCTYGELIGHYGARKDLGRKVIRILHDKSFIDDPTRIFRALRFEQRLGFTLESHTDKLLRDALRSNALSNVHPHRLREELILILKESEPLRFIKRLNQLRCFACINKKLYLTKRDLDLCERIEEVLQFYYVSFNKKNPSGIGKHVKRIALCLLPSLRTLHATGLAKQHKPHRKLESWLVYLMALLHKLSLQELNTFLATFSLRKGERIRLVSIHKHAKKIEMLIKPLQPHMVYDVLHPLSFESTMFFYAYYTDIRIRAAIENYLQVFVHVRLQSKGEDLRKLGLTPQTMYGTIFKKLLSLKLDGAIVTKHDELKSAKIIAQKLIVHKK